MGATKPFGSIKKARSAMKGGGAGSDILRRLKADESLTVRFLQQPSEWHEAYYHFVDSKFVWCSGKKTCPGCVAEARRSKLALANVLDVKANRVIIIQMPVTLAEQVIKRYDRFDDTVMDRDYILSREGSGQNDTRYSADYDPPRPRKLTGLVLHDIGAIVDAEAGDSDDEDEAPRSTKSSKPSRRSRDDDYEDEEEEDLEDEDEEEPEDEEDEFSELSRSELKQEIRKYDPDFVAKKSQTDDDLRDYVRELVSAEEDEEEPEDEPPARKTRSTRHADEDVPSSKKRRDSGLDEFRPSKSRNSGTKKPVVRRSR